MSNEAVTWAFKAEGLTATQKFVLVALADWADEYHSCFPGQKKLAGKTNSSVATVRRALDVLQERGFIGRERRTRKGGYRTSDRYFLSVGSLPLNLPTAQSDYKANESSLPLTESILTAQSERAIDTSVNHQINHQSGDVEVSPDVEVPREDVSAVVDFFSACLTRNDVKHSVGKRWHDAARLLIDRDGYTVEQINWLSQWASVDQFWKGNILSLPKLREKFEQLKIRALSEREKVQAVASATPSYWDNSPVVEHND